MLSSDLSKHQPFREAELDDWDGQDGEILARRNRSDASKKKAIKRVL